MKKKQIKEASTSGVVGNYRIPVNLAPAIWQEDSLAPFDIPVSQYMSADLAYDSYDGKMERTPQQIKKETKRAEKLAKMGKKLFQQNDEEGNPFNGYNPQEVQEPGTPDYIKKIANLPKKDYEPVLEQIMREDLAVWFGTKKKPKGSKQPKGPWVNICRKKEGGGHPPCGRPEADSKGYPKCRAAGVAAKMSDSQKKAACAQKRRAEKSDPKVGKGNKPTMVSYKPKKKNESLKDTILRVLKESLSNR